MAKGVLIGESLKVGVTLTDLSITVTSIRRSATQSATPEQAPTWTLLYFAVDDNDVEALAAQLSGALDGPGWYVDLQTAGETFVVFPGQTFRYQRGDGDGRRQAAAYARQHGIPEEQLDWPV
jgi:hypothetical protein